MSPQMTSFPGSELLRSPRRAAAQAARKKLSSRHDWGSLPRLLGGWAETGSQRFRRASRGLSPQRPDGAQCPGPVFQM